MTFKSPPLWSEAEVVLDYHLPNRVRFFKKLERERESERERERERDVFCNPIQYCDLFFGKKILLILRKSSKNEKNGDLFANPIHICDH